MKRSSRSSDYRSPKTSILRVSTTVATSMSHDNFIATRKVPRPLVIAFVSLSWWPWAWTIFLYAAAWIAAMRLGHWPGCCREAAKSTLPEPLATSVKAAGLFGLYGHVAAVLVWLYLGLLLRGTSRRALTAYTAIFVTGVAVAWAVLHDLDPGHVLDWAVD